MKNFEHAKVQLFLQSGTQLRLDEEQCLEIPITNYSNTDEKLMMMQQDDVTTGDLLQLGEIWGPATPSEQTLNFPNSLVFYTINKGLFFSSQEC